MNRNAIKARLVDIIRLVKHEMKKHPTEWYPLDLLNDLLSIIENGDDIQVLSKINTVVYFMIDQFFDYHDRAFVIVTKFLYDIEALIAVNHARSVVAQQPHSVDREQMDQLLAEWLAKFPPNGDIPDDTNIQYINEFVKLYNMTPVYWNEVFPEYVKSRLAKSSEYALSKQKKRID